jgi:transcriptional regulator GlxA family with amidase domain
LAARIGAQYRPKDAAGRERARDIYVHCTAHHRLLAIRYQETGRRVLRHDFNARESRYACNEPDLGKCNDWLRDRAGRVRRVRSVCTGAFLLAEAGVLDRRRAVTHWSVCADLARRFPAVRVETDPIFVRDGPVWTSAGVTAGIDLALALIQDDLGRSIALAVARYLVVFLKRPGGQAQFSAALSLQMADDRFGMLHDWIAEHLTEDLSLPALAQQAAMSERSFSRHYVEATGLTPARAIEHLRVEAARRMLSDSQLPIKRIAQRCGFGSEETMRRSFLRLLSVAPQDYRARFSS